jgi:nitrogen PTS system EIIA component
MSEIMTSKEVGEYLRISEWQIRVWAGNGDLKASKMGKAWKFKRSDVERFWEQNDNSLATKGR